MSQWINSPKECPCGQHKDCYRIHKDGHGFCFSCGKTFKGNVMTDELETEGVTYEYLPRRGITKETHEFFGVKTQIAADGTPRSVAYVYPNGAAQIRLLDRKVFYSVGDMTSAAGWALDKFPAGSAKAITITEGNDDAMSVYQMLGGYPVYSVRSASSALRDVRADFERLNSFSKIYLALDDDEPGRKAAAEIAAVFDFNKVYHVKLAPYKDPNEFLQAGKVREFCNCWYNAGRFMPDGVVSSFSEIDTIIDNASKEPGHPWPFAELSYFTDGLKRGKAYLLSGKTGIGKTEVFHAVEYHLAKTDPDANIAIIHLEEPLDENVKKMVGYELKMPTLFSDSGVSDEVIKDTYRKIAGREDRIHFYNHYGSDDPDILTEKIRFFVAACKCKYVFFDNITLLVTGRKTESDTKDLDYFSTQLEMLVKQLNFVLLAISHENAEGDPRGSKNISMVFDVWINIARNPQAENPYDRNIQYVTLNKNRGGRGTGPVGRLIYDEATATLNELTPELPT